MSAPSGSPAGTVRRGRFLAAAVLPLLLLAAVLAAIVALDPARQLARGAPPVEELVFERVVLGPDGIRVTVVNDGPDPVIVAQVLVDEAYWQFSQEPPGPLDHLGRARLQIPYPWVEGELHELRLLSSTGVTFDHTIPVAIATPRPTARTWGLFALIGLYVGVLPVAIGLLWYPLLRHLGRHGLDFVLALTVGLLAYLLVDTAEDALGAAAGLAGSYQGAVLFVLLAALTALAIETTGRRLAARRGGETAGAPWFTALLTATGIGLHNLGEGLAIGAAYALGEATLGTLLILGFALHNTTEGLAIVAPLARTPTGLSRLLTLGLIAGAPTILGAWIGGLLPGGRAPLIFLALGAGALAQVSWQILRSMARGRTVGGVLTSWPVVGGLAAGIALLYATGLLVG